MPALQSKWLVYANGYNAGKNGKPFCGSMDAQWVAGYMAAVRAAEMIKKGKRGLEIEREEAAQ